MGRSGNFTQFPSHPGGKLEWEWEWEIYFGPIPQHAHPVPSRLTLYQGYEMHCGHSPEHNLTHSPSFL